MKLIKNSIIRLFMVLQFTTTVFAQVQPEGDPITEVLAEIIHKLNAVQKANRNADWDGYTLSNLDY